MFDYQIAIPSYRRAELLKNVTLKTLERYGAEKDRITIFVANEEQADEYRKVITDYRIVVAEIGQLNAYRFYHRHYYAKGTPLLNLDDDIYDLKQRNDKDKLEPYDGTIDDLVKLGFDLCETSGAKMWGINPVNNGFFMSDWSVIGLRYICGNFYGNYAGDPAIIGDDRPSLLSSGDDYETTMRSFIANGAVARIEWLTPMTKYFAKNGGIDSEIKDKGIDDRQIEHTAELQAIILRYPDLARPQIKANGMFNIQVKKLTFGKIPRIQKKSSTLVDIRNGVEK
jgi:hypothetical protein